ncbi:hypothetical protein BST83_11605 [Polaribacter filamentus]|uniref:Secretion system C-terminal sorting domain-containing protein n=1 Tax=Polaribacter filamentus TaxID=53483 RepID=A0A2S7KYI2_9FLAO|nr:T9SS type A sorting domain-containing protein [Polaribacter filamentus]PQB07729.1 hypothetical protein BST83_11605 [Polaribacter filamentus]
MKKQVLFLLTMTLFSSALFAQDITWTNDGGLGDGTWAEPFNWSTAVAPVAGNKVKIRGATNADNITINGSATCAKLVLGDGGGVATGKLIVANGGNFTIIGNQGWSAAGWSTPAEMEIQAGGVVNWNNHMWLSFNPGSQSTLTVAGTLKVMGGMFGFNFENANAAGTGELNILDGGVVELDQFHAAGNSMNSGVGVINIADEGTLTIYADRKAILETHEGLGQIVAGSFGTIVYTEIEGVTGQDPDTGVDIVGVVTVIVTNSNRTSPILSLDDKEVLDFKLYPNPASDVINIESKTAISTVKIVNLLGQSVLESAGLSRIDVSSLSAGLYILKIADVNGSVGVRKILKK